MSKGFQLKVGMIVNRDPVELANEFIKSLRIVLRKIGEEHHALRMPKHFTYKATAEYGYARRTPRYMGVKKRLKHHQRPLEFTGRLKRALLSNRKIRVYVDLNRVKMLLTMRAGSELPFYAKFKSGPDVMKELKTVSAGERREIIKQLRQGVAIQMRKRERKRHKRVFTRTTMG